MRRSRRLRSRPELRLEHAARQGRNGNNFDLLRLLAATLVIISHSLALTVPAGGRATLLHEDLGEAGVVMFFGISGFLVARSWAYDPNPLSFAMKRALRLMPALVVSLLLTALVLGPLVTTLPLRTYLEDPGTKAYVLSNATFQITYGLPGVFAHARYPNFVNGSLWTLPLELKAYCLVVALGLLGLLGRRRLLMPVVTIFFALLTIGSLRSAIPLGDHVVALMENVQAPKSIVGFTRAGYFQDDARLFASFALGAGLFALARWVPLRWSVACALTVAWVVAAAAGGADAVPIATAWLLPYVVLLLAYRTTHIVRLPARLGDYSYGLYIIAFPVQQAVVHWFAPSSGWVTFVVATPIALAFAVASWHLVEAPALTLKQRMRQPLERASAAHPLERIALQPQRPPAFAQPPSGSDVPATHQRNRPAR